MLGRYLFSGEEVFKQVGDLSGGEQSRLALARLTLLGANLLLLDEPTNHLDIPSQEVLQQVFAQFEGTILLVSHDRYLINALSTTIWAIEEEKLYAFPEGYSAYRAWLAARYGQRRPDGIEKKTLSAIERAATKAAQRVAIQRAREIQELEQTIDQLESRLAALSQALELAGGAHQLERVRELGVEYSQVEAELQTRLAQWAKVAG
jgi:ATP-binding cassette subfamily F protein 3